MALASLEFHLGDLTPRFEKALQQLIAAQTLDRLLKKDHTLWRPEPQEITNRLGWLDCPDNMRTNLTEIRGFADRCRAAGLNKALLMGMGGSSLAPEVLAKVFGRAEGFLELSVLDSTDPAAVLAAAESHDPATTLHLVCSKSGGTIEPLSLFKYFYNRTLDALGPKKAGTRFAAITDPGSGLAKTADSLGFCKTFLNDPNIGGRYSALSYFGLAPGGLLGLDLDGMLTSAGEEIKAGERGIRLGAALGAAALAGQDKLTLITSPRLAPFGDWVEQLIAESTGKQGRGILPVVGEPETEVVAYGPDRIFVGLSLAGDAPPPGLLDELKQAGRPVIDIRLEQAYDLGGQFLIWELATAVAGILLDINPFDQPNVESAKKVARGMMAAFEAQGALPRPEPVFSFPNFRLYGSLSGTEPDRAVKDFLAQTGPGAYVALQVYARREPGLEAALKSLRKLLMDKTGLAVTLGYGPRYLHSTGQLHKGDAGQGLFIQITIKDPQDLAIPAEAGGKDSKISFSVLKAAQALGDARALSDAGRPVMRCHGLGTAVEAVQSLSGLIGRA